MTSLLVNSNRLELVDQINGLNKSIEFDTKNHLIKFNDGSRAIDYSLAREDQVEAALGAITEIIGSLNDLVTEAKSTLVAAINEVATQSGSDHSAITTLTGDASTDGSVLNSIKTNASSADYDNQASGYAATTISGAIDEAITNIATAQAAASKALNYGSSLLKGNNILATTDFIANSDAITGNEFPYKASYTVGTLAGDRHLEQNTVITNFDTESILAENFASFSELALSYDDQTDTTSVINTIFAREPMVVSCDTTVIFASNVY